MPRTALVSGAALSPSNWSCGHEPPYPETAKALAVISERSAGCGEETRDPAPPRPPDLSPQVPAEAPHYPPFAKSPLGQVSLARTLGDVLTFINS